MRSVLTVAAALESRMYAPAGWARAVATRVQPHRRGGAFRRARSTGALTTEPAEIADADLVVVAGSRSTVDDLVWLRGNGLADAVVGTRRGAVFGTHWHGAFESDWFRRAFLTEVAAAGRLVDHGPTPGLPFVPPGALP